MNKLNLGCGSRYREGWTNVDHVSWSPLVLKHDMRLPLPFSEAAFDLTYSSHVLEHFSLEEGAKLVAEQFRVLRPGGVIRCVVPDLEALAKNYLSCLAAAKGGTGSRFPDYHWSVLAMFDQVGRNQPGGEMIHFLRDHPKEVLSGVFALEGVEIVDLHRRLHAATGERQPQYMPLRSRLGSLKRRLLGRARTIATRERMLSRKDRRSLEVGRFRVSGEVHYWMYDEWSLGRALRNAGFIDIVRRSAHESYVSSWTQEHLDTELDGSVYKPSSLFMEARKPHA